MAINQTPHIYSQPDIKLDFADCIEYIDIPIDSFMIGPSYTLDEEGNQCIVDKNCVKSIKGNVILPNGVEYESSYLTKGVFNTSNNTIEVEELCTGEFIEGFVRIKVTEQCSYPFTVAVVFSDEGKCLEYITTQNTNVDAGFTCKQVKACLNTELDCTTPLTK